METDSSSTNDDANTQGISSKKIPLKKDAIAEKQKLLQDIQEIRCIIKQYELQMDTLCFEDIEENITKLQTPITERFRRTPNIEADVQNELHNFAGFNCVKFRRNEIVFNFTTMIELEKNNTYAVQIFIKDGKGFLGKWVMPMSINMNDILTKTPIDKLQNMNIFLKNCKRHISCYVVRQEQYLKLKKHTSHLKYCKLQSNTGYTQINLELYGIDDTQNDENLNLIIYIIYHSDEARPYQIKVDTINQDKLSSDRRQRLKVYLKSFKTLDLTTAFEQILADDNSGFIWMKDGDDSPLELNDISSSSDEENFLKKISNQKKSLRKNKKKRELQKKWKRIKQMDSSFITAKNITLAKDNIKNNRSKAKVSYIQKQNSIRKKKVENVASTSHLKETTPFKQPEVRLRQTKLNFQASQDTNFDNVNENSIKSKLRNKSGKSRTNKLLTSTPLVKNIITRSSSSSLNADISSIEISEENKLKLIPRTVSPLKKQNIPMKRKSTKLLRRNK